MTIRDLAQNFALEGDAKRLTEVELCQSIAVEVGEPNFEHSRLAVAHPRGVFRDDARERHLGVLLEVTLEHLVDRAVGSQAAALDQHCAAAKRFDSAQIMADEENGASGRRGLPHLAETLFLEPGVTDREDFVDDQDVRL